MPDKLFLYDCLCDKAVTYDQLLKDINTGGSIRPYCYEKDLYSIFLQLITSILNKVNLTLLDYDFSEQELQNLGIDPNSLTYEKIIDPQAIDSVDNLIAIISKQTGWEITLYTSGTTGLPKKVVHNLSNLTRAVRISEKHKNDIWGFCYNPTHIAGLQVFFQALLNGNSIINLFGASRSEILSTISQYQITNISATPTFYRLLLPLQQRFDSVLKLTSGGEKFDARLSEELLQGFPKAKIRNIYASTEAGTILETKDDRFIIKDSSCCKVIDNQLFIHKSMLGDGTELACKDDEWYATGDLVEILSEEPLTIKFIRRINEMINVGGYKVNPNEVEETLLSHPAVLQAFVYGKPNPVLGNVLMADVVIDGELKESELREYLNPLLQSYKIPRMISFVKEIELTRTGKLKRT